MKKHFCHVILKQFLMIVLPFFFAANIYSAEKLSLSTIDYPPLFQSKATPGLGYGIGRDIVSGAFMAADTDVEYKILPMIRSVRSIIEKKYDANVGTIAWFKKDKKDHLVDAVDILSIQILFFYKKSRYPEGISYNEISELRKYTIGNTNGSATTPIMKKAKLKVDWVSTIRPNFKKLSIGRVDLAIAVDITGWAIIRELFPDSVDDYAAVKKPIVSVPLNVTYLKGNPDIGIQFKKGLDVLIRSGKYMEILERYYGKGKVSDDILPKEIKAKLNK